VIPSCRVQPSNTVEVAEILAVVREQNCHFAVLAGGTAPFRYASNADQGITIDMQKMKTVELIASDTLMTVGAGALWADVYRELDPRNLSATGARNSLTGVTGSILGGTSENVSRSEIELMKNLRFKGVYHSFHRNSVGGVIQ
jgi:FAD/FMN-containing dehydrogenase